MCLVPGCSPSQNPSFDGDGSADPRSNRIGHTVFVLPEIFWWLPTRGNKNQPRLAHSCESIQSRSGRRFLGRTYSEHWKTVRMLGQGRLSMADASDTGNLGPVMSIPSDSLGRRGDGGD
eukprot:gene25374-biopygen9026